MKRKGGLGVWRGLVCWCGGGVVGTKRGRGHTVISPTFSKEPLFRVRGWGRGGRRRSPPCLQSWNWSLTAGESSSSYTHPSPTPAPTNPPPPLWKSVYECSYGDSRTASTQKSKPFFPMAENLQSDEQLAMCVAGQPNYAHCKSSKRIGISQCVFSPCSKSWDTDW